MPRLILSWSDCLLIYIYMYTYMLSLITPKFKGQVVLYRDDGLAVCKATPKQIEKTKQEVCEIFKSNGLKITIEANKKTINFLDVTLNLTSGSYKPFMKPNNRILYVHRQSNHPPALLKNIPENINKRLTSISSNQKVFDEAIPPYQKALDESGYNHKLTYNPQPKRNRNRQRKIVYNIYKHKVKTLKIALNGIWTRVLDFLVPMC